MCRISKLINFVCEDVEGEHVPHFKVDQFRV
jgi:hypothetical protein